MKTPLEYTARAEIRDGRPVLIITGQELMPEQVYSRFGEKQVKIIIARHGSTRSSAQNRYYWGVIISIIHAELQNLGNEVSVEETHQWLKHRFLPQRVLSNTDGEAIGDYPPSTTLLTKSDFGEYIDDIRAFASDSMGLYIPDPNETFDDVLEPVKLEGGITILPNTPETVAASFVGSFIFNSASDLNACKYQIINSALSEEEKRAAAIMLSEKASLIGCQYVYSLMEYISTK